MVMILSQDSIEQFLRFIEGNGGSHNTIRAYRSDLQGWLVWINEPLEESDYTQEQMESVAALYLTEIRKTCKPNTTNRKLAAIKSWAKWAGMPDFLAQYRRPTALPTQPHPIPEGIPGVDRMIAAARKEVHKALVALQGLCGLRMHECLAAQVSWFDFQPEQIWLHVDGKGDKQRRVPVSLEAWMAIAPAWATAMSEGSRVIPLTDRAARRAVNRIAVRAGMSPETASHDLRATFATAAWHASADKDGVKDIRVVQRLMGHANSGTTEIYIDASETDLRNAVNFHKEKPNG